MVDSVPLNGLHDELHAHDEVLEAGDGGFEDIADVQELHALHHVLLDPELVVHSDVGHERAHVLEQDHHVRERGPHEIHRERNPLQRKPFGLHRLLEGIQLVRQRRIEHFALVHAAVAGRHRRRRRRCPGTGPCRRLLLACPRQCPPPGRHHSLHLRQPLQATPLRSCSRNLKGPKRSPPRVRFWMQTNSTDVQNPQAASQRLTLRNNGSGDAAIASKARVWLLACNAVQAVWVR